MKKMNGFRKLLALAICAMMVIGLIPGIMLVATAEDYNLWVGGAQVTSINAADIRAADGYTTYSGKTS